MRVATGERDKLQRVWTDLRMLATPLFIMWLDTYVVNESEEEQKEIMKWDPDTIRMEIEDDFKVQVPQPVLDKIFTARELVTTDRFFQVLADFQDFCNILSGTSTFDPRVWDPADAAECAWGITEALLLDPPDDNTQVVFAEEIVNYVSHAIDHEGIVRPPDVLQIGNLEDKAIKLNAAWSDDPDMLKTIWDGDTAKTNDINRMIKERLRLLIQQLEGLPLLHGDTGGIVEKLLRVIPRAVPNQPEAA
jgi:hypothetical protein